MYLFQVDPSTGETTPADSNAALLAADDLAAIRGDGIFEAALLRGSTIRAFELHLERFEQSARLLDLSASRDLWRTAVTSAVAQTPDLPGDASVRWYLSRGKEDTGVPTAWILISAVHEATLAERERALTLVSLTRGYPAAIASEAPWLLIGSKSLSYAVAMAATRFAKGRGADDAIFVTTDGFVLEAPRANVVIARDGTLLTPDPSIGVLHGTTQRMLFGLAADAGWNTRYARLRLDDLFNADGAWLVSSVRTAIPIHRLNGNTLTVDADLNTQIRSFLA